MPAPEKGITCGLTSVSFFFFMNRRRGKVEFFRSRARCWPSSPSIETSHRSLPLSLPFEHGLPLPAVDAIEAKRRWAMAGSAEAGACN